MERATPGLFGDLKRVSQEINARQAKRAKDASDGGPNIGTHVRVENRAGELWIVLSNRGKIFPASMLKGVGAKKGFLRVSYGTRGPTGSTWILQRADSVGRNPVWTDNSLNKSGEGEHEQRHCVVTRTDDGIHRFWFFYDEEDEIASIERSSKKKFETILLSRNRGCDRESGDARENETGYVCWISDYLYFGARGLAAREAAVAQIRLDKPHYTRDFGRYMSISAKNGESVAAAVSGPAPTVVIEEEDEEIVSDRLMDVFFPKRNTAAPNNVTAAAAAVPVVDTRVHDKLVEFLCGFVPAQIQEYVTSTVFDTVCVKLKERKA